MVPDVLDWLEAPVRSDAIAKAKAAARAHIAQFIKGEKIDDLHFMKRIEDRRRKPSSFDHQVWAFRPLFNPQHRYFGVFATKDWFVVCTKQSRDRLAEHDNRWHKEIDKTSRIWASLFGLLPRGGATLGDYISQNAERCDGRW
jgi:macrodomain Ter protein organizer (MatP/YcbG family)